jgi:hypothetical protein
MSELYLETEAERRLWEELRQAGITFTTKAGQAASIDPDDPRGRTTFLLDSERIRIRYQGRGEFGVWDDRSDEQRTFAVSDLREGRMMLALMGAITDRTLGRVP